MTKDYIVADLANDAQSAASAELEESEGTFSNPLNHPRSNSQNVGEGFMRNFSNDGGHNGYTVIPLSDNMEGRENSSGERDIEMNVLSNNNSSTTVSPILPPIGTGPSSHALLEHSMSNVPTPSYDPSLFTFTRRQYDELYRNGLL